MGPEGQRCLSHFGLERDTGPMCKHTRLCRVRMGLRVRVTGHGNNNCICPLRVGTWETQIREGEVVCKGSDAIHCRSPQPATCQPD